MLRLPQKLDNPGILVAWSLEHEHVRRPIGFSFGNPSKGPQSGYQDPVLFTSEGHLMTVAPTGSGKGTGCIIPTLLRYPGPVIVIDPKGENVAITARRRRELGHRVIVLDPMRVTGLEPDRFDPVDIVKPDSADIYDDITMLADLLTSNAHDMKDYFWIERGIQLVSGLLLYAVRTKPELKGKLHYVRELLSGDPARLEPVLEEMKRSEDPDLRAVMGAMTNPAIETVGGYTAFAQNSLSFLGGSLVNEATQDSTFDIDDVTRGDNFSIYLVIPPAKLESHARLLRVWIGVLFAAITRRRRAPRIPTLFILDEAAQLGTLPQLRQAITLLRGYGVRTWSFWQDLSQLKQLYSRDWQTMVNNCKVFQAFGVPNMSAAMELASLTGYHSAEDLIDLDRDEMLLLISGDEAVIAQRPHYLSDPPFQGLFDSNPFYDGNVDIMPRSLKPRRAYVRPQAPRPSRAEAPKVDSNFIQKLREQLKKASD